MVNEATAAYVCARCSSPASLQCPKCMELQLPKKESAFCSQECFKAAWKEHKQIHKEAWLYVTNKGKDRSPAMPDFAWTGALRPDRVGPRRSVPKDIPWPDYGEKGYPISEMESNQQAIVPVRSPEAIAGIREACKLGRTILDLAGANIRAGVTTDEIDRICHEATVAAGAYPSPLNYFHFPKSLCTSVNEVICHGIPDKRPLQNGDVVNVDITVYYNGYHGDLNETFLVGEVDEKAKQLVKVTYESLQKAIAAVKPGMRYQQIGDIISRHAESHGFSVVRSFCGHGIGDLFHCAPNVPHYAGNKARGVMKEGHTFTIEPMINEGVYHDKLWPDGWTAVTQDGKRSAQFEHTLLVTKNGCEVLTARTTNSTPLWWEAQAAGGDAASPGTEKVGS